MKGAMKSAMTGAVTGARTGAMTGPAVVARRDVRRDAITTNAMIAATQASPRRRRASAAGALGALSIACAALLVSLAAPPAAEAAVWRTCNGSPVIWRGGTSVHRNRCSIADSGPTNSAYWNALDAWNRLAGAVTGFFVNATSDCSISHGDGENEIALVDRTTIDGNNGLTVLQLGPCVIGANDLDEADVMIANDLGFLPVWGNFFGTTGRSTFVHELGHFFGFNHDDTHAVMRTSPPHLVGGGLEPSTNWPSDAAGVGAVYGFVTSRPNLIPGALGVVGGVVQPLDPVITFNMCRGGSRTTRVYLGNSGNLASGTYTIRIRLNTLSPTAGYSAAATVVASFSHSLAAFSQGTFDLPFTIPSTLPDGIYYIYVDLDPAGAIPETLEGDNSTVSAMRILVSC